MKKQRGMIFWPVLIFLGIVLFLVLLFYLLYKSRQAPGSTTPNAGRNQQQQQNLPKDAIHQTVENGQVKNANAPADTDYQSVVDIQIQYDQNASPQLSVLSVQKRQGILNRPAAGQNSYTLSLLDGNNTITGQQAFLIPNVVSGHVGGLGPGTDVTQVLPLMHFTLTLPYNPGDTMIRITDPSGKILLTNPLTIGKPQSFVLPTLTAAFGNLKQFVDQLAPQAMASQSDGSSGAGGMSKVRIVFVPAGYNGHLDVFQKDAERFKQGLLDSYPYKDQVDNLDFDTTFSAGEVKCGECGFNNYMSVVNDAQALTKNYPHEILLVIVCVDQSAGCTGTYSGALGTTDFEAAIATFGSNVQISTVAHEFGHTWLLQHDYADAQWDQFIGVSTTMDNQIHFNCFAGNSPPDSWKNTAGINFKIGCSSPNWYHFSDQSVMGNREIETGHVYNPIEEQYIVQRIQGYLDGTVQTGQWKYVPGAANNGRDGSQASAHIEITYSLKPNGNDTLVNNQVQMTIPGGTTYNDSDCVEVGTVATKCSTTNNSSDVLTAAQDMFNTVVDCTSTHGHVVSGQTMDAARPCMDKDFHDSTKTKGTYTDDKITAAVKGAAAAAIAQQFYQCVGFVENVLTLTGDLPGIGFWPTGASGYDNPPNSNWVKVTKDINGGVAQPGDIFSYTGGAGHIGIVKAVPTFGIITVLDANMDLQGSMNEHDIAYVPGDTSGTAHQPRFLRKKSTSNGGGNVGNCTGDVTDCMKNEFGVVMDGFPDQINQWAYQKFTEIKNTRLLDLAETGLTGHRLYIQDANTNTGANPGYSIDKGWSYTPGCNGSGTHGSPNIWLVDKWPRASDTEQQEYLDITLMHEIGHIPQRCNDGNTAGDAAGHEAIFQPIYDSSGNIISGKGAFSYYAQHGNDATLGCPTGVNRMNEDYADMIAYYLNPNSHQKYVCDAQTSRPANPYDGSALANAHLDFVKRILGQFP